MNKTVSEKIPHWVQQSWADRQTPAAPDWVDQLRQQHWKAFHAQGLPTRKNENWKNADLSFLAQKSFSPMAHHDMEHATDLINQHRLQHEESILLVLVNGYFMPVLSDMKKLQENQENILVCNLNEAYHTHEAIIKMVQYDTKKYPFANLNLAMNQEGLFLLIQDGGRLALPIHLLSLVINANEGIAHPRCFIMLGKDSQLALIEEHFSHAKYDYMMNKLTTIIVGKNAELTHYKIQQEGEQAIHLAHTFVLQMEDSRTNFINFTTGASFARDDLVIKLQGPDALCQTAGFYHLYNDQQYIDYHIDIDHAAPRTQSEMLYKGILENKSRAVFTGRVHVAQNAQKTVAFQANHNLLLSQDAEVFSTPILEIYADDVKCKHGATVGQIDEAALFYLRSRGIEKKEAMNVLLQGFAEEIFQRVAHPGIMRRVQEMTQSI